MANVAPSTIPGVGIDLADVARMRDSLDRGGQPFMDKVFTPSEQSECQSRAKPHVHFAARFAAKEAAMKALGTGWTEGIAFTDFEIISDGAKAPRIILHGVAAQRAAEQDLPTFRLSMSHTDTMATAIVVVV